MFYEHREVGHGVCCSVARGGGGGRGGGKPFRKHGCMFVQKLVWSGILDSSGCDSYSGYLQFLAVKAQSSVFCSAGDHFQFPVVKVAIFSFLLLRWQSLVLCC